MRVVLALAAAIPAFASAAALDMPSRKPGLWDVTMTFASGPVAGRSMASQHCIDAEVDKMRGFAASGAGKCDFVKMDKTATGFVFDSECKLDSGTVQTHGVVTGSLDAAYSMDVTTKHVGAAPPSMPAESHMKIDGKWLGACKAGQRPGDVMMPNGMTINVLDAAKMAPPQMPKRP